MRYNCITYWASHKQKCTPKSKFGYLFINRIFVDSPLMAKKTGIIPRL